MIYKESTDPIPTEELHQLVCEFKKTEDLDIADKILKSTIPFISLICHRYARNELEKEELTVIGLNVVFKCLNKWKPEKGSKFISFAGQALRWKYVNLLNQKWNRACKLDEILVEEDGDPLQYIGATEPQVQLDESLEYVKSIIRGNNISDKKIYILSEFFLEGKTSAETAKENGWNSKAVANSRYIALATIKRKLLQKRRKIELN